jgi:hypothetical protein
VARLVSALSHASYLDASGGPTGPQRENRLAVAAGVPQQEQIDQTHTDHSTQVGRRSAKCCSDILPGAQRALDVTDVRDPRQPLILAPAPLGSATGSSVEGVVDIALLGGDEGSRRRWP